MKGRIQVLVAFFLLWSTGLFGQGVAVNRLLDTGKEIVCRHGDELHEVEKIKEMIGMVSPYDFEEAASYRAVSTFPFDYDTKFEVFVPSEGLRLSVELLQQDVGHQMSIENRGGDFFLHPLKTFIVRVNDDTGFPRREGRRLAESVIAARCATALVKRWHYEGENTWVRAEGWSLHNGSRKVKEVFFDREIEQLEDIYCEGCYDRPLEEVRAVARRTDRILVAVLDTGVDFNHPDIAFKIPRPDREALGLLKDLEEGKRKLQDYYNGLEPSLAESSRWRYELAAEAFDDEMRKYSLGWDYKYFDANPYDYATEYVIPRLDERDPEPPAGFRHLLRHGTPVVGILAEGNDDVAILPIKYPMENVDSGRFYDAVRFAYERGARIVNMSFSWRRETLESVVLCDAIRRHPGMIFVAGAGNDAKDLDKVASYPIHCDLPNMIVVTSVDSDNKLAHFANFGKKWVHLAAEGVDVPVILPEGIRGIMSGTSISVPWVSGAIARMLFANPALGPGEVFAFLEASITPVYALRDKLKFGGVLNAEAAVELVRESVRL